MNITIMSADDLVRYAQPSTELEQVLHAKLMESREDADLEIKAEVERLEAEIEASWANANSWESYFDYMSGERDNLQNELDDMQAKLDEVTQERDELAFRMESISH
jgi:chromosome segregation ATPase